MMGGRGCGFKGTARETVDDYQSFDSDRCVFLAKHRVHPFVSMPEDYGVRVQSFRWGGSEGALAVPLRTRIRQTRWYWRCPMCNRRCKMLFCDRDGYQLGCRICHDLGYASQQRTRMPMMVARILFPGPSTKQMARQFVRLMSETDEDGIDSRTEKRNGWRRYRKRVLTNTRNSDSVRLS